MSVKVKAESTIRFYDALSIVFFVLAAASLSMLTLFLVTDFVVLGLGAVDIGNILSGISRMVSLRGIEDLDERRVKAKDTVECFHAVRCACFAVAAVRFAVALTLCATDLGVVRPDRRGRGGRHRAVS